MSVPTYATMEMARRESPKCWAVPFREFSAVVFFFPISILEKQDVLKTSICKENCTVGEKLDILKSCFDVATQTVRRTDHGTAWGTTSASPQAVCPCCYHLPCWSPWSQRRTLWQARRRLEAQGWGSACSWTAQFPEKTAKQLNSCWLGELYWKTKGETKMSTD